MKSEQNTKKSDPKKGLPERNSHLNIMRVVRAYFSTILLLHKNLGALRIIAAYIFVIFALCSLWFTIKVPITSDFRPPTEWAKAESRAISGIIMVMNLFAYGMIMMSRGTLLHAQGAKHCAPTKTTAGVLKRSPRGAVPIIIRSVIIGLVLYSDVFLVRVTYMLIRDGSFF